MKVKLTQIVDGRIQFSINNGYEDLVKHCSNECFVSCWKKNMRTDCACSTAYLYKAVVRLAELEHGFRLEDKS